MRIRVLHCPPIQTAPIVESFRIRIPRPGNNFVKQRKDFWASLRTERSSKYFVRLFVESFRNEMESGKISKKSEKLQQTLDWESAGRLLG
jgi:hypothetical protein